jgi:hypothetical protein
MRRRWGGIRLSSLNTSLFLFGLALLIDAMLKTRVRIEDTQIGPGVNWWQRLFMVVVGVSLVVGSLLASRGPVRQMWTGRGFLGVRPQLPTPFVKRPDLAKVISRAVRQRTRPVAIIGIGGTGKSTLAAQICGKWRVRRRFRGGVTWLSAGPGADPVTLLVTLARRLGVLVADAGFTTVEQGQDTLAAALHGRHVLVAVDNVWERHQLDALLGLGATCTVLFTTRKIEVASIVGARPIRVDELTQEQALELLASWKDCLMAELPLEARQVCTRVGNLALGVAMAGAMVARGRSFADFLALIDLDLARVRADLNPEYQHATLRAAIEAGISDLPDSQQRSYDQLAIFAKPGPFNRGAAEALFRSELPEAEVGDLLAQLTGWSLLTPVDDDWYVAHDLQYEVLNSRLTEDELREAHSRLLDGYKVRYLAGWATSAADSYLGRALAGHLCRAHRTAELRVLLTDVRWIEARVANGQLNDLISDYQRYADDSRTHHIGRALKQSALVLAANPDEVIPQLAGRLIGHKTGAAAAWATGLLHYTAAHPWLVPLGPALMGTSAAYEASTDQILSMAASADGTCLVTGGLDGRLHVWDPLTGDLKRTIASRADPVLCLAVTEDGSRAWAGAADGRVRRWNLETGAIDFERAAHASPIRSLAMASDGSKVVTGEDEFLMVWSLAGSDVHARSTAVSSPVKCVVIVRHGSHAIVGAADGSIKVRDLSTGFPIGASVRVHRGTVECIDATAGAGLVVTGGADGLIRLWDLGDSRLSRTALRGHIGPVTSVVMTDDKRRIVSGGDDQTIRVWDLASGKQLAVWHGDSPVIGCSVRPGAPLQILAAQKYGRPYRLEFRTNSPGGPEVLR